MNVRNIGLALVGMLSLTGVASAASDRICVKQNDLIRQELVKLPDPLSSNYGKGVEDLLQRVKALNAEIPDGYRMAASEVDSFFDLLKKTPGDRLLVTEMNREFGAQTCNGYDH